MKEIKKIYVENGYYVFKLEKILANRNISKNKIIKDINTDFKVLQRLCTGELNRIDIGVLARICDYLNCTIVDLIEYFPNEK